MTTQHTPGPWTGWYTPTGSGEAWAIGPEGCCPQVALVDDDPDGGLTDGATIESNARLIAAAPELLATLKDVLAHLRSITLDPGDGEDDAPALMAAEALIAKAEGRDS